ncbi:MAG: hypothetical protein Q4C68_03345, partial [Moraxella sp.]|nr:hypothetical protein [Moraxella sp.]
NPLVDSSKSELGEDEQSTQKEKLLFALRFFHKKTINGGLTVYDARALTAIKAQIKALGFDFGKNDKPSNALDSAYYLRLMAEFCRDKGVMTRLVLTGDVDEDKKRAQWVLDKLRVMPVGRFVI